VYIYIKSAYLDSNERLHAAAFTYPHLIHKVSLSNADLPNATFSRNLTPAYRSRVYHKCELDGPTCPCRLDSFGSGWCPASDSCENGKEHLGAIKGRQLVFLTS
jgi:hypothetical protein